VFRCSLKTDSDGVYVTFDGSSFHRQVSETEIPICQKDSISGSQPEPLSTRYISDTGEI